MKNLAFLTLIGFSFLSAKAQITVTASDMPNAGNIFYMNQVADFALIDVSVTGANQTWDYSGVIGTALDTINTVSVSSTPITYQFFFNNQFLYPQTHANYAVTGAEFSIPGQVSISDRFDFFKSDTEGHKIVGFGANLNNIPTSVRYNNIDFIYDFPMNYLNHDTSFADFLQTVPSLGTYGANIRREKEVDGWGSITTPNGTYSCLRVKTTLNQTDTIYIDQFSLGTSFPRLTKVTYDWITNGEGVPVFSVTEQSGIITSAAYKDDTSPNAVDELTLSFQLYPNPTKGEINILSTTAGTIQLFDLTGQLVFEQATNGSTSIDTHAFPAGLYQLMYQGNDGSLGSKKVEVIR